MMKQILQWALRPTSGHGPVALVLVAVFALAAIGISPNESYALKKKKGGKGYLGISMQLLTEEMAEGLDLKVKSGVLVSEVFEDSPAEEAGLEEGDVIVEFDGEEVTSTKQLRKLVSRTAVGKKVEIKVVRDQDPKVIITKIGERPEDFAILTPGIEIEPEGFLQVWHSKGRLGVRGEDLDESDLASYFDVKEGGGVLVLEVYEESVAEEAGVKTGDVIVQLDDEEIGSMKDLQEAVGELDPEDEFELTIIRRGKEMKLTGEMEEGEDLGWHYYLRGEHRDAWPFLQQFRNWQSYRWDKGKMKKLKEKLGDARIHLRAKRGDIREQLEEIREMLKELEEEITEKLEEIEEE